MLNKKILVTGATGFVGKQVIKCLCNLDVKICLVLRSGKENIFHGNKAVQSIRQEIAQIIPTLRSTNDISKMELLKKQLERIKRLGGFEKIVPVEGIVFTYGGNTYKLTGAFAPINQILGTLKYSR